jgi:hypothetical protein
MVNHIEGQVLLDGKVVEPKFGEFPQINNEQTLSTEEGRVEVLLTPGAFLRMAEGSSFKMLSNKLSDTALEILSGSAMIEIDELLKDNAITLHFKGATVSLVKQGLYRFDADYSRLRIYDGEAEVTFSGHNLAARKGKQVVFGDTMVASNFDTKVTDPFSRWASRRAEYISVANVSAARNASTNGLLGYGTTGTWAYNPWFGLYTFLPGIGYGYSPYGWGLYSPYTVGYAYVPYLYGGGGSVAPSLGRVSPATSYNGNAAASALTPARATPPSEASVASADSGGFTRGGISGGGGVAGAAAGGGMAAGGGASRGASMGGGGTRGR